MKLLIILLILTISIQNCLTSGVSYTLVPYKEKECKTLDKNLGVTFPLPTVGSGYSITPVVQQAGEEGCAVIYGQSSNSVKINWYLGYDQECITPPPKSNQPLEIENFSTTTCVYSNFLGGYYKLFPTSQVQFPDNALKIQITTKSSGCNTALDGYFNYLYNNTFFAHESHFVSYSEYYYCDQSLNPFIDNCNDDLNFNCTASPLKTDCSSQLNFVYSCFGSSL